ncbi:MAG: glycosyltransferase family 1 protein [Candidatus Beckwithbacteria bacterium]|nr:glycosyltransferase family 1 protein [Candidatus Beckwithbacteria bacterium]
MRIGIDISQIVYQTGVSRYTTELVKHLLKIDHQNEYFLYAGSWRQRQFLKDFFNQVKTGKSTLKLSWFSPKLADLFWNRLNLWPPADSLDVFHASNWVLPRTKSKLVTTIHDLTFLKYPKTLPAYLVAVHTRHLQRAKKYADQIITVSQSTKKDLIDYGIPATKIKVVYEAASPIFKPVNPSAAKRKYSLTKPYFLSVGTLEPRKNIKNLIKAFALLPKRYSPELVIAGKFGWGENYPNHLGVKFIGFIPDEDLAGLYSGAKAFIYPSLYEGFGLPVLEAMSCGCPVITSNLSSLPEVGGDAALYVNPEDIKAISQAMIVVPKLNLREKSLAQAKKFSWQNSARETLKIYQEVAGC